MPRGDYGKTGQRWPTGYTGPAGDPWGGRMMSKQFTGSFGSLSRRLEKWVDIPRRGGFWSDVRAMSTQTKRHYQMMGMPALRADIGTFLGTQTSRAGRAISSNIPTGLGLGPGGLARAGAVTGLGYLTPMAVGGALGAGIGGALGIGPAGGLAAGAGIGATLGVGAGLFAYSRGLGLLKTAGEAGLSAAGIAGGGLEIMFGAGATTGKFAGRAAAGVGGRVGFGAPKVLGIRAAGGLIGGLVGSALGDSTGATLMGTAIGFGLAPRVAGAKGGVLGGLIMRHPIASILGGATLLSGVRAGREALKSMVEAEPPSSIGIGNWDEVYGMSHNNLNSAGVGLAAHYNSR